jgi:hypothetical protein
VKRWIGILALGALAQIGGPTGLQDKTQKKAPPVKQSQTQKKAPPVKQSQLPKKSPPVRQAQTQKNEPLPVRTQTTRTEIPRATVLQKARTGQNTYGTSNHSILKRGQLPSIEPPPKINNQAYTNVRRGYYPYGYGWRDAWFAYPYYAFDYSQWNTVPSPWYYYPQLPGYLAVARIVLGGFTIDFVDVRPYTWDPSRYVTTSYDYPLDLAVTRLVRVYEHQDLGALDRLVLNGYWVNIESEYGERYQLRSSDFYDLMLDNVSTTRTLQFRIERVQTFRAGATVQALHTFLDPFGQTRWLRHVYVLLYDENGYHIASLRVSRA